MLILVFVFIIINRVVIIIIIIDVLNVVHFAGYFHGLSESHPGAGLRVLRHVRVHGVSDN